MVDPVPLPAVSVLIPTKNRKQMLLETVQSVLRQSVPVEVIVIDDGSIDGTSKYIGDAFANDPRVKIIRRETSGGPTLARNTAAGVATTPYLFTIDDDCLVPSPRTFEQTLAAFDHPRVGAVTIPFINIKHDPAVHYRAPATDDRYLSSMFYGGMVAFLRSAYEAVGGYRTFYIIYVEEPDLAARLMNAGYVIRLGTADPLEHLESPVRNLKRNIMLSSRNQVLYHWYNTPMPAMLIRLPVAAVGSLRFAFMNHRPDLGIWGVLRGLAGMWHERAARRPLQVPTHKLLRRMRFKTPRFSEIEPYLNPLSMPVPAK